MFCTLDLGGGGACLRGFRSSVASASLMSCLEATKCVFDLEPALSTLIA